MGLRVLVDTNILLDYLLCREPYDQAARDIVIACKQKQVSGCIAAHSVSSLFFVLRKAFSIEERRRLLRNLCELFEVECIVTRNISDYKESKIPCIDPEKFCQMI